MHKFKILKNEKGEFRVQFVYNSEVMVWSENYAAKASAKNCVESIKKNAPGAAIVDLTKEETGSGYRFEIDAAKSGETFVRFRAANGEILVRSETYSSKSSARNCAESIKKNAPEAPVEDETAATA
ncbi:YegP family protein [Rhizobium cremeum]|uniref:YegP family protein n=1 Tax=Rhizobium cremeum TaxID=2813827 RepID=UPI003CC7DF64|nr:YegP family protein [Rhizobium cremeum]MCJ8000453.1 YegP family protein [Rhizobium cremeum]